jgi:hypothetical protein
VVSERKAAAAQGSGAASLHSIQHGVHGVLYRGSKASLKDVS